jgi:hypothetical protein
MNAETLRALSEASPFIPFRLSLANGRVLEVPSRELFQFFGRSSRVLVEQDDGAYDILNLSSICTAEVHNSPAA